MKLTWLGHSGFRLETVDAVILIDPWITGNPMFPEGGRAEAIAGATHVLVTHGHGDHTGDAIGIAKETGATIVGIYDLISWWTERDGINGVGFNKGGTVDLAGVADKVSEKLVRRHPHVFGDAAGSGDAQWALESWEAAKKKERAEKPDPSALAGVPTALPALQRSRRLGDKAIAAGFRWPWGWRS